MLWYLHIKDNGRELINLVNFELKLFHKRAYLGFQYSNRNRFISSLFSSDSLKPKGAGAYCC